MSKLSGLYEGDSDNPNYDIGHFFVCIDPENFTDIDTFKRNVGDVMREIKETKSVGGVDEVLVPGEIEYNTSLDVHKNGIEVPSELLDDLKKLGFDEWQTQHTTKNSK